MFTLWGIHSVVMFSFAFFRKFQLPFGLHNSALQYQPNGAVEHVKKA